MRLGIVDLGSNTARLVVFDYEPGRWFRLVHQIREPVRLGEGLGRTGTLRGGALRRADAALVLFAEYVRSTGVEELRILGTSALRDADNRDEFLDRVAHLGLPIEILEGREEARLGVLAVANGFELEEACVVDLGGGSAQVSIMREREFAKGRAYPLGTVRLSERFLHSDPPKKKEIKALEREVADLLGPTAKRLRKDPLPLVAMGGTIRNLARAIQKSVRYPLMDRLHGFYLEREALEELVDRLLALKAKKRGRVPGIKPDRADVILGGALVYRWLLRRSKQPGLWISGYGLREGALFSHVFPEPHLIGDLRAFGVSNLINHYAQSKEHVGRVRELAGSLFEQLKPLHGRGRKAAALLDAAALLQDIGLAVNYYRQARHGAYLVSAAPLNGFEHREQALLALLVRYHLRGKPKLGEFQDWCRPKDEQLLLELLACLRVADHLDRARSRRVQGVDVEIADDAVKVMVLAGTSPAVELWGIDKHLPILEVAFRRPFQFLPVRSDGENPRRSAQVGTGV